MAWVRKSSSLHSVRATPTTENAVGRRRRAARRSTAGSSLRAVRSPDAPKTTSTHGGAWRSASSPSRSGLPPAGSAVVFGGIDLGGDDALGLTGLALALLDLFGGGRLGEELVAAELVAEGGDDPRRVRVR